MLKKTIEYEDFNGVKRSEDFYFNFTKAEVMDLQFNTERKTSLSDLIQEVVDSQDNARILSIFKEIVLKAYGVKSDDGRRFIKSKEIADEFAQTNAFDVLYWELATDADTAAAFVNAVIPDVALPQDHKSPEKQAV